MGKTSYGHQNDKRKKLSWMYRRKAKLEKAKRLETNSNDNAITDDKSARIVVRNLSFKVTDEDVKRFYEPFGPIHEINLLRHSDGKPVGCGFIQFKRVEDASKAIFNTNKKEFLGRIINSDWAIPKSKFCEKLESGLATAQEIYGKEKEAPEHIQKRTNEVDNINQKEKNKLKNQKRKKCQKVKKQRKRARIVVRNLSFQVTDNDLKEHFSKYGEIEDIKVLTKPDGKLVGCAFVQFNHVQAAAKAVHYANMKPLLERPIIVDWAVPKNQFSNDKVDEIDTKPEVKNETEDRDPKVILVDASCNNDDLANSDSNEVKIENIQSETELSEDEIKNEVEDIYDEAEDSENNENDNGDDDDDDDGDGDDNDDECNKINQFIKEEDESNDEDNSIKSKRVSNDVSEGRTVFLKNVPFSVKNDELKRYMEQFGPVYYALICIDPLTEHSKGTAFIKFKNVADAENCLSAGTELRMRDQIIDAHRALHRNEVENKTNLKQQRIKDSRNLYLVKEGVVLAGSPAAAEVSVNDMAKRLKLEQWKSQMLRNLNMFVSRLRLVVHNLPTNLDDIKLRQLFKNHSGSKAIIKEARVMRDLKNVDTNGTGKSKEYGFVTFTNHEDALKALRSINNNPNIFSKSRRPIVGFSIENRIMVNAKERRIQKSRDHNPLWPGNKNKRKNENVKNEKVPTKRFKDRKLDDANDNKLYAGLSSKLGQDKLRSNFNLKSQAALHVQAVKKDKKLNKVMKQSKIIKKERAKKRQENIPIKQVKKFDADDANFNKLVNNYKDKLKGIDFKKSKWYETSTDH